MPYKPVTNMLLATVTNTFLGSVILGSALFLPSAFAADVLAVDSKIGSTVTITGCLHAAGKHEEQFVLVGVVEKSLAGSLAPVPYAIYMLDSTKDMKPLVGQLVDVTGKVVSKDTRHGVIKVEVRGDAERSTDVKVETASTKDLTTKIYSGTEDSDASVVELTRPVYQVHVEAVEASGPQSGPACR